MKILSTIAFSQEEAERITSAAPDIQYVHTSAKDPIEFSKSVADTDVLYTGSLLPQPDEATQLSWVQLHTAGADHILDSPLYLESDVRFTTTNGMHAAPIAEYVLAMMGYFSRQIPRMLSDKAAQLWPSSPWETYLASELRESCVGIFGYGAIGREVARLCRAFGMEVLAVKRDLRNLHETSFNFPGWGDPDGSLPDRIYPPEGLHSFLSACDYVVVTAPLTSATRHLFNAEAFSAMKAGSVFINVARGGLVDEAALVDALTRNHLRGAALDVFDEEPLPPDDPLWSAGNLIISPHISGVTRHYNERALEIFVENIRRFSRGEPLINQVDRKLGY